MAGPRVILGMSGGVDSSVAASVLVEQGYEVHGVTLQVWEQEDESVATSKRWQERGCCKVGLARYVAKRLGIDHEVVDTREVFRTAVIDDFVSGYLSGTTPNPCVRCNERVKLRVLYELAASRDADYVATGHYATVLYEGERHYLCRSPNARKDQSYFLYRMDPRWLRRLLFPVGLMQKSEVWARAEDLGLPVEELKESQEICFVSQGDYRAFLENEAPRARRPGAFVDMNGRLLGEHAGVAFYTRGQRRGLGIATGRRLYVQSVVPQTNTLVVGTEDELLQSECTVGELNVFDPSLLERSLTAETKIRYASPALPATLDPKSDGMLLVRFHQPQWAVSPGQSAVFYLDDRVLGGGIIQQHPASIPA